MTPSRKASRKPAKAPRLKDEAAAVLDDAAVILFATDAAGIFTLARGKGLETLRRKPGRLHHVKCSTGACSSGTMMVAGSRQPQHPSIA